MPGGLKKKSLRTELDLTPKQKMFVEIYVKDWGSITQAEALKRAGYVCTNERDYGSEAIEILLQVMEIIMLVDGKMIKNTDKELILGQMEVNI